MRAMADPDAHSAAPQDAPRAMSGRDAWHLLAPWLGYVLLAAAAILGLFTASGAPDSATYASGLATFALAVALIALRMNRQLGGREIGFLLPISVESADALIITVALLTLLGVVGAVLAAAVGGVVYTIGLALFIVCGAVIFFEMKRYFDHRDHPRQSSLSRRSGPA